MILRKSATTLLILLLRQTPDLLTCKYQKYSPLTTDHHPSYNIPEEENSDARLDLFRYESSNIDQYNYSDYYYQ